MRCDLTNIFRSVFFLFFFIYINVSTGSVRTCAPRLAAQPLVIARCLATIASCYYRLPLIK